MHNISAERASKPKRDRGLGQRSHPWLRKREGPMRSMGGIAPQVRTALKPWLRRRNILSYKVHTSKPIATIQK